MRQFSGMNIVITGASSGIGQALVEHLVQTDCTLFLCARSTDKLEEIKYNHSGKPAEIQVVYLDLADSDSLQKAKDEIAGQVSYIDFLINNGGISQRGHAVHTDYSVVERIMQVNFMGTVEWTTLCMPLLQKSAFNHITVISSVVGEYGFPLRSSYAASKHALKGYFESMQLEPDSPSCSIVSPGRITTNISMNALTGSGAKHGEMDEGQAKGISAEKAAAIILKKSAKKKKNIFIGSGEIVLLYISRYCPPLFRFLAKKISPK